MMAEREFITIPKGGRPSTGTVKRTYRLDPADLARLEALAGRLGEAQTALLQRALSEFLAREERAL